MLVLVGCGPEDEESDGDLAAETVRIAQEYQQSGDLGSARAQLEQLDAANPTQFLIFLAEERAGTDPDSPETAALVHFALALGLQSAQLMDYAVAHGLLANTAPPTPVPVAQSAAQSIAPLTSTEQTPTATVPAAPAATSVPNTPVPNEETSGASSEAPAGQPISETVQEAPAALPTTTAQPPTAVSKPQVQASNGMNVRSGPGTAYPVVGALNSGEQAEIVAKNPEGDWWQISLPGGGTGWVFGQIVTTSGDTSGIAVATDIPAAPPTPTPAPVAEAPTAAPAQPTPPPADAPAEQPAEQPSEQPAEPPPSTSGNDFVLVERRLWTVEETGGAVDSGGSVRCGEKHELYVHVMDANGNPLNGVTVSSVYIDEAYVTGAQGKGDGVVEFVLGHDGQGVKVTRDADGREVTSDVADGMIVKSPYISHEDLIAAHYCRDKESCDKFNYSAGCWGHHSWTVKFKRRY